MLKMKPIISLLLFLISTSALSAGQAGNNLVDVSQTPNPPCEFLGTLKYSTNNNIMTCAAFGNVKKWTKALGQSKIQKAIQTNTTVNGNSPNTKHILLKCPTGYTLAYGFKVHTGYPTIDSCTQTTTTYDCWVGGGWSWRATHSTYTAICEK